MKTQIVDLFVLREEKRMSKVDNRSSKILHGVNAAFARSLYKSMGFSDDELINKPVIGIANSWTTLVPGHFNLNQISEFVKKGIYAGGGMAVEFGVIAVSYTHLTLPTNREV